MKFFNHLSTVQKYTLLGFFFGLFFPVFSIILDCYIQSIPLTWVGILAVHDENVIHYVVDSAPFILGLAGLLLGISHKRKNDLNQNLSKVNEALDTFTFKLTHDLKSPAVNIKGLIDILNKDDLDGDFRKEVRSKLDVAVTQWIRTFNDFTDLLKQEKSGQKRKDRIELSKILRELLLDMSAEMEASKAVVNLSIDQNTMLLGAVDDFKSIFKNLITNAIKYCHPDKIPVINILSKQANGELKIVFEDNGVGIDLDLYKDKIFDKFHRTNEKENVQGSGIGLYLVKSHVEDNHGRIEIESIPGQGTQFTLIFKTY